MTLLPFTMIRLRTDRVRGKGIMPGALGVVLDVYGDEAYEVEFTKPDGTSYAWFAVVQDEVEPATEPAVSVPSATGSDRG